MVSGSGTQLPKVFGKYYLLEVINVGGMAEVLRAKMFGVEGFEKIVAIKKILPEIAEDNEFINMFIDEAKIAVQLSHPNIVQILELGKIDDSYFIAMENVFGKDLKTIRKRMKQLDILMSPEQSAYIVSQVCEGLDYAHHKTDEKMNPLNIIHRDISPQNIMISFEGNVKLIDFGIAKARDKSTKTQAGLLKGKFSYMSPEQVGGKEIDGRSDIFSLGIVLYEMLTGKRLFLGKSDVETLEKIRKADVPPPSVFNNQVTPELDQIVLKALAKAREDRFQTASEFSDALKTCLANMGKRFSRNEMMNFMARFFANELEEEKAKMDSYRDMAIPSELTNTGFTTTGVKNPSADIEIDISKGSGKNILLILLGIFLVAATAVVVYFFIPKEEEKGILIVDSTVSSSFVNIDEGSMNHTTCTTPCKMDLLPGEHIMKLSSKGYLEKEEKISVQPGITLRKFIKLIRIGELKTTVTVKSEPEGASIFINEADMEETTPAVLSLPVGSEITIRLEKEGYYPVQENIGKLKENVAKEVPFVLKMREDYKPPKTVAKPAKKGISGIAQKTEQKKIEAEPKKEPVVEAKMATLSLNSKPWTTVYIDGKLIKTTPILNFKIPAGDHKVRFENKDFGINETISVKLSPNQTKRIIKNF